MESTLTYCNIKGHNVVLSQIELINQMNLTKSSLSSIKTTSSLNLQSKYSNITLKSNKMRPWKLFINLYFNKLEYTIGW